MATIKSFTSLEQSRKLAEILPIESADCFWDYDDLQKYHRINWFEDGYNKDSQLRLNKNNVCAWSLSALLGVLPRFIEFKGNKYYLRFMKEYVEYANDEVSITGRCLHTTGNNNLVDACYEMILKLHELNLL